MHSACAKWHLGRNSPDWLAHLCGGGASAGSRVMSSLDQWEKGIPWESPQEGIKGGTE